MAKNKDEIKEHLREEREQEIQMDEQRERNRRIGFWLGGGLIIVGAFVLLVIITLEEGWTDGTLSIPVSAEDHTFGNPDATVTLVEYGDFQCPACASIHPVLNEVKTDYGDRILFSYRHFPLPFHDNAELAARASEAAALQDKFWSMHDKLFENQSEWSREDDETAREILTRYAEELELDIEQFTTDIDSDEVKDAVKEDKNSGNKSEVTGTPSIFINEEKIQIPAGVEALKQVLDDALNPDLEDEEPEGTESEENNEEQEVDESDNSTESPEEGQVIEITPQELESGVIEVRTPPAP